jgi:hypothetical protein
MHSECACESSVGCREVIVRAYRQLRARGRDDVSAFRAAVHVLDLRHPESRGARNLASAARWLSDIAEG